MKPLTVLSLVGLVALPLAVWADPPDITGTPGRVSKDLYAVLVIDTDADRDRGEEGIGPSVKKDREHLVTALEHAFRDHSMPGRLVLRVFDGTEARSDTVRRYLRGLKGKVKATDTVFFYYCGHGGVSTYENQRFAFYHDGDRKTYRFEIEDEIDGLSPRLKIILYDCCSNGPRPRRIARIPAEARPRGGQPSCLVNPKVFQHLFFEGSDWVIIAGATKGMPSYGDPILGGCFTYAFLATLNKEVEDFGDGKSGRVTWKDFYPKVRAETNRLPAGVSQKPEAHFLNQRWVREKEFHLKFVNHTSEDVTVRVRSLRTTELGQLFGDRVSKGWIDLTVPAGSELLATEGGAPLRTAAYQYVAVGQKSKQRWVHSTNPNTANQETAFPESANRGLAYDAVKEGALKVKEHVFDSAAR
jgi:hypothetical protein